MSLQAAADLLWRHWREGRLLAALPPDLAPADRAEAYRIQALLEPHSAAPLYGWKIAATSLAGQRHIGADGPLAGRLLAEQVLAVDAEVPLAGNQMRVAEPEVAFRMGRDLPPRAQAYIVDEVMAAVADAHPAIEFPDSRLTAFERAGEAALIADNACAHLFVLGPPAPEGWRAIDLAAMPTRITAEGREPHQGRGGNALDDPRLALTWLANALSAQGLTLRKGQVVTTGTTTVPLPVEPGDVVRAELGGLGALTVRVGA
ncbi:2-keto-4-pentenoate hydratase [Methylobacterium frigidaeris]|uniref:2-keto-4-pentenoate hydratase n=1 Tax=Methylobacterium frigidaeris TaxID=2038277 RepID=A0AA37M361_9HYPH|nr:fumarylacetoacetate hydrolase family protein [Methylobacterium frigidaeris]PIK72742.1 hydratase [Methylobacterium frigidaeris]GJD60429.1 2-keto-4-pentenoate hydratase [Methylobacterium frigidaeris]